MNRNSRLLNFLLLAVIGLMVLSIAKDFLIKTAIEISSPKIIGAQVRMGGFSLGVLTQNVRIKNFRLYNPPGFPNQEFVVMPEVQVKVDIPELVKGRMHLLDVVFNMEKMVVVKNKEGKTNIDSLKIIEEQKEANKGKPTKLPVFKIDMLKLNIGKVVLEDYTHAPPVEVHAYNVAIKEKTITNINGLPKLVAQVMLEAIKPTAIRSAGLFAATTLMGVAFLPAVAVGVVVADDTAKGEFHQSRANVYQESLNLIKTLLGTVKQQKSETGQIWAKVYGCDIIFQVQDQGWGKSQITIKARKFMLARLEVAEGLLYQLTKELK